MNSEAKHEQAEYSISYDAERNDRLREEAWFNCAKCGREVRESEWISLCNDCGEEEEEKDRAALAAAQKEKPIS